ncbi:MAG: hypothetical protein K6T83_18235, partial [Alicyclobacillus sp.]|nr:hypothetical protein [Alicyclobacillus sp.]
GEVIAYAEDGRRSPVGFARTVGRGRIVFLGVAVTNDYEYGIEVIHALAEEMGIVPRLRVSDANVFVTERVGEDGSLLFLNNADDIPRVTTLERCGSLAFEGGSISVPARAGLMLPINLAVNDDVQIEYSTVELVSVSRSLDEVAVTFRPNPLSEGVAKFLTNGRYQVSASSTAETSIIDDGTKTYVTFAASPNVHFGASEEIPTVSVVFRPVSTVSTSQA